MKKYFFICFLLITCSITFAQADTSSTAGFLPGQIWYSENPLKEGDTVKIYTAIWNGNPSPLSAHVEFYDNKVILGARDVTVPATELLDVSISWKVTAGDHSISAKISSSSITADGKKETVTLENNTTTEDKTFVSATAAKTDVIKDGITKATEVMKDINVPVPIASSVKSVDAFRANTYENIADTKAETQARIDALNGVAKTPEPKSSTEAKTSPATSKTTPTSKTAPKIMATQARPADATEKPIAYVKLFFFTVLAFIFGSKFIFYGLILLIAFLILRFIYRKIRHKSRK